MRKCIFPLLVVLACGGGIGIAQQASSTASNAAQEPPVTFRTEINFVEVHAIVTDEDGTFVNTLSRDDFEIYEDGELQTPTVFTLIDLPIERPITPAYATGTPAYATGPVESDVRATTRTFDGRLYVLVLDDLHTSITRTQDVREAASHYIERYFGTNDLAAVVHASGREDAAQEFTNSRTLLLAAIDKFQGRKLPSTGLTKLALNLAYQDETGLDDRQNALQLGLNRARDTFDLYDAERGMNARRVLGLVENVATGLSDIQGRRKALLLFSEGIDYDIYEPFNRSFASAISSDAREAVAAAQRANVSVYAIDPRGLAAVNAERIEMAGFSQFPQLQFGTFHGFAQELLLAQESLISLADETGGLAVINTNDVAGGLARIALENSRYYLLGYHSDPAKWSGDRFRKIEVRVKRPDLRVRARRGFVPPDAKAAARAREAEVEAGTTPALKAALSLSVPVGELPLRAFAAPFRGTGKNAAVLVAVELDGRALKFEERDGRFTQTLEVSIVAADHHAKVQGEDHQTFELNLLPETYERVSRTGVRILSQLELPPARYQIRIGAHAAVGGAVGTVAYDLEVPDYSKARLTLSGIMLTSTDAESLPTPGPDIPLRALLPTPPVATRSFTPSETLTFVVEVNDNSTLAAHTVNFAATVRRASDGRPVFTARDDRPIEASNRLRTHGFQTDLPLKDFSPGLYVLRVEATSTAGGDAVYREVPFEVERREAALFR